MATTRLTSFADINLEGNVAHAKRMPTRSVTAATRAVLGDIGNSRIVGEITNNKLIKPGFADNRLFKKSNLPIKKQTKLPIRKEARINEQQDVDMEQDVQTTISTPMVDPVLPPGVKDIDLVDAENPQLCAEYVPEMYAYLRQIERETLIKPDFLLGCSINGKMRGVLLDWLTEVHLQFKLLQETLYMTTAIIDRFLEAEGLTIRRNKLQLVGVAAMLVSSKVEEMYAPEINDFVYITDNAYTSLEIRGMEMRILKSINFSLGRPLPLHFLRRNSKAGDVDVLQHTVAKYLIEMTITEYDMAHYKPSIIAAAALYLSLRLFEPGATLSSCWTATLQHYSTYTQAELLPVVFKMAAIVHKAKESKFQVVHTKYLSKKFLQVAQMKEFKGEEIRKLAAKTTEGL